VYNTKENKYCLSADIAVCFVLGIVVVKLDIPQSADLGIELSGRTHIIFTKYSMLAYFHVPLAQ